MARKSRGLIAAAATFAASPQGRRLIAQAKAYAQKPENRAKVQRAIADVRARRKGGGTPPAYGTPPQR
jgi:hypothetical protein